MKRILMLTALIGLCFTAANAQNSISLEQVAGTVGGDIQIGTTVNFQLRIQVDAGVDTKLAGTTNGFRLYSPEGAVWTTTTGEYLPAWPPSSGGFDFLRQIQQWGNDGIGSDTIAFNNATLFGNGCPPGYNEVAWQINAVIPDDPTLNNKTLCIDTCSFVGPANLNWLWNDLNNEIFPFWAGAQCFTIVDPNATGGTLEVAPDTLVFGAEEGGADPAGQSFTVSEAGGGAIAFAVAETSAWMTAVAQGATTPADVDVTVAVAGLTPGMYFDSVEVSSGDADNSPVFKYVSFEVTAAPRNLVVSPDTLLFVAEEGSPNPVGQAFSVSEAGGDAIAFSVTAVAPWLNAVAQAATTPTNVDVTTTISGLTPGIYFDSILVTSGAAANSPVYKFVSLEITVRPKVLAVDPTTLTFNGLVGDGVLPGQTFEVSEVGGANIGYTASFLSLPSTWATIFDASGTTPGMVTVVADIGSLGAGVYVDTISVGSPDAVGAVQVVVTLNVTAAPEFARLQVIHNAADPTVAIVDVWVNNEVLLDDFGFREATAFIDVPTGVDLLVGVSLSDSSGYSDIGTYNLSAGVAYILVANGLLEPGLFQANPDGRNTAFELFALPDAREAGINGAGNVDFAVLHGATDAPTVDVFARGVARLVDDAAYGDIAPYQFVPAGEYILDVTLGGDSTVVAGSFLADLNGLGGGAALVFASGFLTPADDQNGEAFGLFAALPDGQVVPFPPYVEPNDLVVNPTTLSFTAIEGDTSPQTAVFTAIEAGGGTLGFTVTSLMTAAFVTFDAAGTTPDSVTVTVDPSGLTPGVYDDTLLVVLDDNSDTERVAVVLNIEEFVCTNLIVSDTLLLYTAFEGDATGTPATRAVSVRGSVVPSIDFEYEMSVELGVDWISLINVTSFPPDTGVSIIGGPQDTVMVSIDPSGLAAGIHSASIVVMSESPDVCAPALRTITVQVTVFEVIVPSDDTVRVVNTPAVPGMSVTVPVELKSSCVLHGAHINLMYDDSAMVIDSVSFANSVFSGIGDSNIVHGAGGGFITVESQSIGVGVNPTTGNWFDIFATVLCETAPGVYNFSLADSSDCENCIGVAFIRDCGADTLQLPEYPEFETGGIIVDNVDNYVCGYVVDTAGNSIAGATVQLWAAFPIGLPIDEHTTSGIGSFAFSDFNTVPFSLFATADGYYPNLVEDLNFGDKGIMIVMTPLPEFNPTNEWVDYYCNTNTYRSEPLPVGTVVEAWTNGMLVGRDVVDVAGSYGFMPVYRDDFSTGAVDGAQTGDMLTFTVNGQVAVASGDTEYPAEYAQVQVCLMAGEQVMQECELAEGWNLVSWRVQTETTDIMTVLGPYMANIDVVLGFERGGLTYDPELPEFSTLWNTDHLSGYWVRVKDGMGFTLAIEGTAVPTSTPIPVTTGWNLVSYLPEMTMAPEDALVSLDGILLYAYGWDNGILTYQPGSQFSNLTEMMSCNGYWVKVSANGELVYPNGVPVALAANIIPSRSAAATTSAGYAPSDVNATTQWMNLYSRELKLDGKTVKAGSVIAAHRSDGAKIGSFVMHTSGQFGFMPVYGSSTAGEAAGIKAGEQFYITVDGKVTDERFAWTSNGDRMEIGNLSATSNTGENPLPNEFALDQNYPNPFNPTTTISFTLPAAGKVKLEVYNILGKLVAAPYDGVAGAGTTTVVWDGRDLRGESVSSGVYFYRLTTDTYTDTKKMMLLK